MESKIIFGQMVNYYRKANNFSMEELGKKLGKTKSTISKWESSNRYPKIEEVEAIARLFDVSVETLLFGSNANKDNLIRIYDDLQTSRQTKVYNFAERQLNEQNNVYQLDEYREEYLYGGASAGKGQYVYDEPVETVSVHTADIPNAPYDIMLKVVGDSMEPAFRDGEYIFVKRTEEIHNGAFGIFIINGESYLKKVYVEEDKLRLVSLNSNYDDLYFDENDDIKLVGRVVL